MTTRRIFILLTFVLLPVTCQKNYAQSETPEFEVGAQFSVLHLSDLEVTEKGFGARFTYNLTDNIAFEAEGNVFPNDRPMRRGDFEGFRLNGGRKTQGLFGIKVGIRREKIGIFGKARPGFVRFSHFERQIFFVCPPSFDPCVVRPLSTFTQTDYALDIGGVVELYPSRRSVVRFDVGDTIIRPRFRESILLRGEDFPFSSFTRSTSHNLQFSFGVGFRF